MKNKKVLIISIIMILILIMSGTVYAYFTTYAEASGNVTFIFNDTEIAVTSKLENGKLNINIENIGDEDTFVRAKVLIPDYAKVSSNSANWTLKTDGYWYYDKVLETGNKSTTLQLNITINDRETREFNAVTNAEAIRVCYNEDGSTYANWQSAYEITNVE